jgi:predicted amidohydrolase YtcJ
LSLKAAFRCFRLDAAYAGQQEKTLGSLEVGKYADFRRSRGRAAKWIDVVV